MKNQLPPRLTGRIQLAFEELVHRLILPQLAEPDIRIAVEYATEEETAVMTVLYGKEPLNPLTTDDQLSLSVLKGITQDIRAGENKDGPLANRITLRIY